MTIEPGRRVKVARSQFKNCRPHRLGQIGTVEQISPGYTRTTGYRPDRTPIETRTIDLVYVMFSDGLRGFFSPDELDPA